jgi:hypothetical protein
MDEKHILTEADLRTEAFLLAQPAERGTWVSLKAAATKRGGNVIAGAGEWDERKTNALLGVRRRDLAKETDLWWWNGRDLHVVTAETCAPASTEPQQPGLTDGKMAAAGT